MGWFTRVVGWRHSPEEAEASAGIHEGEAQLGRRTVHKRLLLRELVPRREGC